MSAQDQCIFCKIIDGEIPSKKVYEDDRVLVFHDINPQAKVHLLIIPKKHIPTLMDVTEEDMTYISDIHRVAQKLGNEMAELDKGFRLLNNCGENGGQEVFHLHYHLMGGEKLPVKVKK
ncbi:MAG: histidine triad nucleotide-binding protein [Bacillaceae bacterium]|nr:histidine triad nucleotide-binding protein [Bacillaceae bacterium]